MGEFGTINPPICTTTRLMPNSPSAHRMSFDSFTGDPLLYGADHITQLKDIAGTWTVVSDRTLAGATFDQGTQVGWGHLFVADNGGNMLVIDYSPTGLIGSASYFTYYQFFKCNLDDLAPLSGAGFGFDAEPYCGDPVCRRTDRSRQATKAQPLGRLWQDVPTGPRRLTPRAGFAFPRRREPGWGADCTVRRRATSLS